MMKTDTALLDKKIELIQWLSSLEDDGIIEKLIEFRNTATNDWWETIHDEEKAPLIRE